MLFAFISTSIISSYWKNRMLHSYSIIIITKLTYWWIVILRSSTSLASKIFSAQSWLKRSLSANSMPCATKYFVASITECTEICMPSYVCHEMNIQSFVFKVNWPSCSSYHLQNYWIFYRHARNYSPSTKWNVKAIVCQVILMQIQGLLLEVK